MADLPNVSGQSRQRRKLCCLLSLPLVALLVSFWMVSRSRPLRTLQRMGASRSSHARPGVPSVPQGATRVAEDDSESEEASLTTFTALRRTISDDLVRLTPKCGRLTVPVAVGAGAARFKTQPEGSQRAGETGEAADAAAAITAWPGASDISLAMCQQDRRRTAELGSFLRSYMRMQARMRADERAAADAWCGSQRRDMSTPSDGDASVAALLGRGKPVVARALCAAPIPLWARHSIVWPYATDLNGLGDNIKGMLSALAASLLSPDPAPLYLAMQAAPDGSFPWVPSTAAGVDWQLPADAAGAIAAASRNLHTVAESTSPPMFHLRRGMAALQLPACEQMSLSSPTEHALPAPDLAGASTAGAPRPLHGLRYSVAPDASLVNGRAGQAQEELLSWAPGNVTVTQVGARVTRRRAGELFMRPLLQEAEEQDYSLRLAQTNELGRGLVDLQYWPSGRCPAEWYHGARPFKGGGEMPHHARANGRLDSSKGTGMGPLEASNVAAASGSLSTDAPWDWDPTSSHSGCLDHLPPELRCYFLKTDVDRLANGTTQPLPPSLSRAHEAACSWCVGSQLHAVDAPSLDSRLCPGTVEWFWYGGQRMLHSLFDTLVGPSQGLVRRVLAAGQLGAPSVHVLHPSLFASPPSAATHPAPSFGIEVAAATATSSSAAPVPHSLRDEPSSELNASAELSSSKPPTAVAAPGSVLPKPPVTDMAPGSVFQPGRQFVIGIHLRLGDEYFHRSGSAHPSSATSAAADAEGLLLAARARRAASAAVHCARLAAAELVARYGPRDSVVWVIAGDDPAGRDHLLRLATDISEQERASREGPGSGRVPPIPLIAAVVSVCNDTLHVAKQHLATSLSSSSPALAASPAAYTRGAPHATEAARTSSTSALTRLFYDVYTEHALLSAAHAIVKTHSGFSRTAALLGQVPLVLQLPAPSWKLDSVTPGNEFEPVDWPPGTCVDVSDQYF